MAGFAGNTSSMISATVVSLGRILFEYGELCFTVCPQLLETVGLLLKHRAREVVGAAVGFIKVAVVKLPPAMIDSFLPALIPALTGWSTEARRCRCC
jgi:ribosomal RNA-processing protein 12